MSDSDKALSIGEVINELRPEFPGLTVSKIRFLESQGLVSPERSSSGYRMFVSEDVKRIQYVLREQRDHFVPLKVIKSKLTAWERGEEVTAEPESGPPPETYLTGSDVSLTSEELSRSSGLDRSQIRELIDQGVLVPRDLPGGKQVFRDDDVAIARASCRLLARGFEGRHLRVLRLAADRETDLLSQLVGPLMRHRNPDNRRRAAEILADCAQAGSQLQEGIVRSRLRRLLEG